MVEHQLHRHDTGPDDVEPEELLGFLPVVEGPRCHGGTERLRCVLSFEGFIDFLAQAAQNFFRGARDIRFFNVAGTRQVNGKFLLHSAGPERQRAPGVARVER